MGSKKKNAQKGNEKSTGQPNGQHKSTSSPKASRGTDASPKTSKSRTSKASASKADRKRPVQSSSLLFSRTSFILILTLSVMVAGVAVVYSSNDARSAIGNIFIQYINPQVLKVAEFLSMDTSGYVKWVEDTLIIVTENQETPHSLSTEPPSQPGANEDYYAEASEQGETATVEEAAASVDDKSEEESKPVRGQESHQEQQEPLESEDSFEAYGKQVEEIVVPPENAHLALKEEETEERIQKPEEEKVRVKTTPKVNVDRPQRGNGIDGHKETKTGKLEIREDDAVDGKKAVAEKQPPISQPEIFVEEDDMIKEARELEVFSEPQEQVIPKVQQEKESSAPTQAQKRSEPPQEQERSEPSQEQERSAPAQEHERYELQKEQVIPKLQQEEERSAPAQEQERSEPPQKQELPQEQMRSEPAQEQETSQPAQRTQVDLGSKNKPESPQRGVEESETENKAQQKKEKAPEGVNAQVPPPHGEDPRETEKSKKKKDLAQARKEYAKSSVTSDADFKIRKKLDKADELLANNKLDEALAAYDEILHKHSSSPRALLGKADTLDKMAEQKRSNEFLEQSIMVYDHLISSRTEVTIPTELLKQAGRRLANRQQFRGWGSKSMQTMKMLVDIFPDDIVLHHELGVSFLMIGKNSEAKQVFEKILQTHPNDGFAKVHLGFIIKSYENNPTVGVEYLQQGIETNEPGTQDGRFYFHLGDGLQRLGRNDEARKVYLKGAEIGVFLSADQRSLYNVNNLTGRPWWTPEQTGYQRQLKLLQDNWKIIRDEGLQQLDDKTGAFRPEDENLREMGEWKQLTMFQQGRMNKKVCERVPKTCALIEQIDDAKSCRRGQVKFSVMNPGVHVWPHCGPTNCRIRAHLGLVVPEGPKIRVVNETRTWKEGEFIIFDDSFEHEVWHDGSSLRLVLIVDFWHPELTEAQRHQLSPI